MAASNADDDLAKRGIKISGGSTVQTSGSTGLPDNTPIYLGPTAIRKPSNEPYAPGYQRSPYLTPSTNLDFTGADVDTYANVRNQPLSWSDAQKRDYISKGILYKLPGFNADMGMPDIMDSWDKLTQSASQFSTPSSPWSPMDVMNSYGNSDKGFGTVKSADGDWLLDAASGEKIKYIGPRTKTTTDKHVDLSSADDVKAITTQMLTELLGRAPNAKELSQYRSSINGYESDNPALTKTVSHLNDQGEVASQDVTTSGGASDAARQTLISDQARQGPEYGKFQSGTTYYNALMQMLGG